MGGKSGSPIVAYRYYAAVQLVICRGPVDALTGLVVGERTAWAGNATSSGSIFIDAPQLFGGDSGQGGVQGVVDIGMGEATLAPNPYIKSLIGGNPLPAYRGLCTTTFGAPWSVKYAGGASAPSNPLIPQEGTVTFANGDPSISRLFGGGTLFGLSGFRSFLWTSGSPYFKAPWWDARRIVKGWANDTPWYSAKAAIGAGGAVASIAITNGGGGYTLPPTIVIDPPTSGTQATATAQITNGAVVGITITNPGSGYVDSPNIKFTNASGDTTGTGAAATAGISALDMNPAHILYQCLTDPDWGMGYSASSLDNTVWQAAADQLYSENFGMSLWWSTQSTINDFCQSVLNTINGILCVNMSTGLFELRLIRDNYTVSSLPLFDESNILKLGSFARAAWGDTANEIVVNYTDREENPVSVAVQDLASIEAQGGNIISVTRNYSGIRDAALAARVAVRDLNLSTTPLAKITITVNRDGWNLDVADVFAFSWSKLGITTVPFRIVEISKGKLTDGSIQITAIEDQFGLPDSAYAQTQPPSWTDPVQAPVPISAERAIEAPWWEIMRNMRTADINALPSGYGYGMLMGARPGAGATGYMLMNAATSTGAYSNVGSGQFTPSGTLAAAMGMPDGTQTISFTLSGAIDVDTVIPGCYFYIDNEAFGFTSFDPTTNTVTATRAVLDTIPATHAVGARVYFPANGLAGNDTTQHTSGETTYYKALTRTSKGVLDLASASAVSLSFNSRAARPYPPGQFKISGLWYPAAITGSVSSTWAHRSRTAQTATMIDYTQGNVGPETGTTYSVKVYDGATLKHTYSGITGTSWSYPSADEAADNYIQTFRVTLESDNASALASWQNHDITFERYGLGFHLGDSLGGITP